MCACLRKCNACCTIVVACLSDEIFLGICEVKKNTGVPRKLLLVLTCADLVSRSSHAITFSDNLSRIPTSFLQSPTSFWKQKQIDDTSLEIRSKTCLPPNTEYDVQDRSSIPNKCGCSFDPTPHNVDRADFVRLPYDF